MSDGGSLQLRFDAFELDERNARLTHAGLPVALTPKAFSVLCALARRPGQLLTKDQLLDAAWGHQHVSESVLKTTISQLRAALADDAKQPRYIETASRRGYRFIPAGASASPPDDGTPAATLVGRQDALARLQRAWSQAQQGRRQVFWVAGEAGVGKTTLIDSLLDGLDPGVACARGQCVEQFGAGEPYLPVLEALGALCRQDAALPAMLRSIAPTWLLQLPWLTSESERGALQQALAGTSQDRMLREMGELLDQYSQRRPVLIVIEDLHWSDHATVRLIDHLARRRSPMRLMWLGSFRPADLIAQDHPLKGVRQELRVHRLCDEMVLEPFSERDVADYIDTRFPGVGAREEFVRSLHAHTDGLPLFIVNVVDDLLSQGVLRAAPGGFGEAALQAAWNVPENLLGVIEKQVERLPGELRILLAMASACGMEFRPETVAFAMSQSAAWVHERCDRLTRRLQWLREVEAGRRADGALDARYTFRHALYRHALYQRMSTATKVEAHHRIAQSLEKSREAGVAVPSAELALHYERGHDPLAALRHHRDAAANAMSHFAPTEAAGHAEQGLALLPRCPDVPERLELELTLTAQLGVACSQLHGVASPKAMQPFERARVLCDLLPPTAERAWVLTGLGWAHYVRGEFAASRDIAQRLHELALQHDDRVLFACACNLLGVTLGYHGDLTLARSWLERGIAACEAMDDRQPFMRLVVDAEVSMRANLCLPLVQMGLADAARAQMDAALQRSQALGQPMAQMLAHWCACMVQIRLHQPQHVHMLSQELDRIVQAHGVAQGEGPARWYRGWALAHAGEPREGHRLILEGCERHTRFGMVAGCPQVLSYAAEAMLLAGDAEAAQRHVDEGLALAARMGETVAVADLWMRQAEVAQARDDAATARQALREAAAQARLHGAQGYEVEALTRLCRLPDATTDDGLALSALRDSLPAGFDPALRAG
jgi:DNA-binding winged helix-turn-helix (wHTH) protein